MLQGRLSKPATSPNQSSTFTPPKFSVALPGLATPGHQSGRRERAEEVKSTSQRVLADWDEEVAPAAANFLATARNIGGEVLGASQIVEAAFKAEHEVIQVAVTNRKQQQSAFAQLVAPVGSQLQSANALTEGRRTSAFNHYKAIAEATQALVWILYTGPSCGMSSPAQHIMEAWQSAEFWANKVLMEYKSRSPDHVAWVKNLEKLISVLRGYVEKHHRGGLAWNSVGSSSTVPAATHFSAPQSSGRQGPAPPPPPAAGSLLQKKSSTASASSTAGLGAVFSEINSQGESVTRGLRKVTDDMKTKNRVDRPGVVREIQTTEQHTAKKVAAARTGTAAQPKIECQQGRKWLVENQDGQNNIIIDDTVSKQTVYLYRCQNSTVQIKGKVNNLTIDECKKTGVVFEDLVASCELVNSSSLQVQVTGVVPTVAIDKCDGIQLYLSEGSLETSITTAKSSAVNIIIPGRADEDMRELYVPEQFVSWLKNGTLVTQPVSHSGG